MAIVKVGVAKMQRAIMESAHSPFQMFKASFSRSIPSKKVESAILFNDLKQENLLLRKMCCIFLKKQVSCAQFVPKLSSLEQQAVSSINNNNENLHMVTNLLRKRNLCLKRWLLILSHQLCVNESESSCFAEEKQVMVECDGGNSSIAKIDGFLSHVVQDHLRTVLHDLTSSGTLSVLHSEFEIAICGTDGLSFKNGIVDTINNEKLFNLKNKVLIMIAGKPFYAKQIVDSLEKMEVESSVGCADYARLHMGDALQQSLLKNDEPMLELLDFRMYFVSIPDDGAEATEYDGSTNVIKNYVKRVSFFKGKSNGVAIASFKKHLAKGIVAGADQDRHDFLGRCVMECILAASKSPARDVGGRIQVKKLEKSGVTLIWDGLATDMEDYLIKRRGSAADS